MLFPRRMAAAVVSIALLATTAGCGGGEGEPKATSSSSVPNTQTPSPSAPTPSDTAWQANYTRAQLDAYKDALSRYKEYLTRSEPTWAAGKASDRAEALFKQYFPSPQWQGQARLLSTYEQVGVKSEGLANVYWSRAKSISDTGLSVVIDQCVDYTTIKLTQNGKAAPPVKSQQKPNLRTINLSKPEGRDWLIYGVVDASGGKARPCTP